MDCLFCKIARKKLPATIIYEDEAILGFTNIYPEAPIHLLFIPKQHVEWKDEFEEKEISLIGRIISAAKQVAIEQKIFEASKLIFNIGKTGHVPHIHLHLLGGWKGETPMHNI